MAKKRTQQVYVRTDSDQGVDYTLVSCRKGVLGGIYFLEVGGIMRLLKQSWRLFDIL